MTTSALYDPPTAVRAAIGRLRQGGRPDGIAAAHESRCAQTHPGAPSPIPAGCIVAARDEVKLQTGADEIQTETVTRFNRNQIIQMVLLVALVYVALPFISTVPTFFVRTEDGELVVGAAGIGGVGADSTSARRRRCGRAPTGW